MPPLVQVQTLLLLSLIRKTKLELSRKEKWRPIKLVKKPRDVFRIDCERHPEKGNPAED